VAEAMTRGQVAQLQDLSKCWMPLHGEWVAWALLGGLHDAKLEKQEKAWLRRLTHQYRHQIRAIKRNQK
jgi:hypothetical protein